MLNSGDVLEKKKVSSISIEDAIRKIDIIKEISSYIELKRSGNNYLGKCPFHDDSTPSLSVSEQKQIWKCFGCGKGGDVVKFVSLYENITYMEALSKLAIKYNLPINIKNEEKDQKIYEVMGLVSSFYHEELTKSPKAIEYLMKREINPKTIEAFEIGYSPNHYKVIEFLQNISDYYLSLYKSTQNLHQSSNSIRDIFEGRLIIPIRDISSRVVGFGGRILYDDKSAIKYLNSPDSFVFKKSQLLFGIDSALPYIKEKEEVIIVEGYFDVIRLYQIGVRNVVAPLGTAFGDEHAKILSRYAKKAYLLFDNDNAGKSASLRASTYLIARGIEPLHVSIEDAKDPDEFGLKFGKEGLLELLRKAKNIIDMSIESKDIEKALNLVSYLQNPQDVYQYTQKLVSIGLPKHIIEQYIAKKKPIYEEENKDNPYDKIPMKDKMLLKALQVYHASQVCHDSQVYHDLQVDQDKQEHYIDINPLDINWLDKNSIIIAEKIKYGKELNEDEIKLLDSLNYIPKEALEKFLIKTLEEQKRLSEENLVKIKNTISRITYAKKYYISHGKS
ncbi:DNA primase [Hydrogenobaculum acidophilum]